MQSRKHGGMGWRVVPGCSLALVLMLASGACTGSAKIGFISLNSQAIDPPRVEPHEFKAQECYWWVDEAGDLNIAMRCRMKNLLLGQFGDLDIYLSFALGKPPAGSGRDYPLGHREVRTLIGSAMVHQRFNAMTGIISVLIDDDHNLHGSFRVWLNPVNQVTLFSFLPQRSGPVQCYGTYHALRHEARGRKFRERSEEGGWGRPAKGPTTRPAGTHNEPPPANHNRGKD